MWCKVDPVPFPVARTMMANNKASKPASKAMTKAAVIQEVATKSGRSKKEVAEVFTALAEVMQKQLGKKGPGVFNFLGLLKLKTRRMPATKERQGPSPFDKTKIVTFA